MIAALQIKLQDGLWRSRWPDASSKAYQRQCRFRQGRIGVVAAAESLEPGAVDCAHRA